jgi:hypothetical protein
MIKIDHIGIPARDAGASARALAAILGTAEPTLDGADDDMYRLDLDGAFLLFADAATFTPEHVAFLVTEERFANIVTCLKQRGLAFGNDPEDLRNGRTEDPHGGGQRIYWTDENGHLFEASC